MNLEKGILGSAIKNARISKNISQEQLAELVNITPTHLKHIESEHRKPSIEVLFGLATALNLSIDSFLFPSPDKCMMQKLEPLLSRCSKNELNIICDITASLLRNRYELE